MDVSREGLLKVVGAKEQDIRFQSCSFHPDGLILGTGTSNGAFKIWDIREQKNVINLTGHTGSIKSISFSENGYLVATGAANGVVNVWDLRKQTCTKSIEGEHRCSHFMELFTKLHLKSWDFCCKCCCL